MLIMMTGQDDSHLRDSVAVSEDDAEEETDVTPVGEQKYVIVREVLRKLKLCLGLLRILFPLYFVIFIIEPIPSM